ncbi:MAG: hypothetical protein ACKVW3_03885 [Phycisphaerales bacterium]
MPLPLGEGGGGGVRLCVVARADGSPLVVLRESFDSRVLLGCVADAEGTIHLWTEIVVQSLEGVGATGPALRESLSNAVLDARWALTLKSQAAMGGAILATGWESTPAPALFLDQDAMALVKVTDKEGRPWELCRDEAVLARLGHPGYGASLHRYLWARGDKTVATASDTPMYDATKPLSSLVEGKRGVWLTTGGLIAVRPRSPLGYEAYVDLLGEEPAKAVLRFTPYPDAESERRPLTDGGLFHSRHGRWGRIVETYHLKLRLIADCLAAARAAVAQTQSPLLNLSAESFRVDLGAPGVGLPLLWTARAMLATPGDAVALRIPGAEAEYFVRGQQGAASIYSPDSAGRAVQGRATIRIREVKPDARAAGIAMVIGTLVTQERVRPAANDVTWVRLHLGSGRIDLYALIESDAGLAPGEFRFRTVPQKFGEAGLAALKGAAGVVMSEAPFQTIPLLSTPCDLYALAVLAIRTLLVGGEREGATTLPMALDDFLTLAKQATAAHGDEVDLGLRVRAILDRDPKRLASLGPHRIAYGCGTPAEALDLVPAELWCSTLAAIARMVPGLGPDSSCRDLGDAPASGPQAVFDRAIADFDELLVRSRSLLLIDWRFNREIHAVIRGKRTGLGGEGPSAAPERGRAPARA